MGWRYGPDTSRTGREGKKARNPLLAALRHECYLPAMTTESISNIRNFSIVAHIDHGKSTLADRLIQLTGGPDRPRIAREAEVPDSWGIARQPAITPKSQNLAPALRGEEA